MAHPFAQIVPLGTSLDTFTYRIPDDLQDDLQTGYRVLVPFGERWVTGIVVGFCETCDLPSNRVKTIAQILDSHPLVTPPMLELCKWMAWYYLCSLSEVISAALPSGIHLDSGQHFALEKNFDDAISRLLSPRQREVVTVLGELGSASMRQLQKRLGKQGVQPAIYGLLRRGVLVAFQKMSAPKVKTKTQRAVALVPDDSRWFDLELPTLEKRAPRQAQCIRLLRSANRPLLTAQLSAEGISSGVLREMAKRNLICFINREVVRDPYADTDLPPPEDVTLTPHQARAIQAIGQSIDENAFQVHLLRGVTGSGKTLVYIRAVAHALASGKGAIVLVPEITLTPQTVRRFRAHFGDRVAVLHSALSPGERYDAWREVRRGKTRRCYWCALSYFCTCRKSGPYHHRRRTRWFLQTRRSRTSLQCAGCRCDARPSTKSAHCSGLGNPFSRVASQCTDGKIQHFNIARAHRQSSIAHCHTRGYAARRWQFVFSPASGKDARTH